MIKVRTWQYDFDVDGGATQAATAMRWTGDERRVSSGGKVPKGSLVIGYILRVLTAVTSAGSPAVTFELDDGSAIDAPPELDAVAKADLGVQTTPILLSTNINELAAKLDADAGVTDTNYEALHGNGAIKITAADADMKMTIATAALTAGKVEVSVLYIELDEPVK